MRHFLTLKSDIVIQISNDFKYILELNVPAELEFQLIGRTTELKRYCLSKYILSEDDKKALKLFKAFWNNLHPKDNGFISSISISDTSGNVSSLVIHIDLGTK